MEKKVNGQKVKAFFKRNVYYIIMLVAILAIAAMITVAVLTTRNNGNIGDDPSGPAVNTPDDNNPNTPDDNNPNTPNIPDGPSKPDKIVFTAPVNGGTLVKDYSMDMIIYSSTLKQYMTHDGIDFGGEEGAAVTAVYDGVVESVSYDVLNGYRVVINHGDGLRTIYASLGEKPLVEANQTVKQGTQLGVIGTSATSEMLDGAHVHFAVTVDGKIVNPYDYLPISWEK